MSSSFLHGADYNPDQWLNYPGIIDEDFRLLGLANMNSVSLGIFSWAALEPEEGRYTFDWMDDIFARAGREGVRIVLATPSGGKPHWLALKYPEVRRVRPDGSREPQQGRHNHCLTSPVYRERVRVINTQLARRYGKHPALELWHISNEFNGYCYCNLCVAAFQEWLRERYLTLEALNEAWWARFWSHTYTAWEQVNPVDSSTHGLEIDWQRFMTHQCASFIENELVPIREHSPGMPVTTNMFGYEGYDRNELAKKLDVISWDSYPSWHQDGAELDETRVGAGVAFQHDLFRSLKGNQPFLLMETTPSAVNWYPVSPLERPGIHRLGCLQAVAHGADGVCYFQFRKGRGSSEKFHGAVIDHAGHENTRVFREVSELGGALQKLKAVVGSRVHAEAAVICDYQNRWAIDASRAQQNAHKNYSETCLKNYQPLWQRGIATDVIDSTADFSKYRLVIAPMLYMVRGDVAERLTRFVENGGTLVTTYFSGIVNDTDLCFLGGFPGPLRKLLGIWVEEMDALPDSQRRKIEMVPDAGHGLSGSYEARHFLDLPHLEGARALAVYAEDFYKGRPALTVNECGKGRAYYVASRNDDRFLNDFLGFLAADLQLPRALPIELPHGVTAQTRFAEDGRRFIFVLNFTNRPVTLSLDETQYQDLETGEDVNGSLDLPVFGSRVLVAPRR